MDAEPSTSTVKGAYASSPPKKRKSLGHLNSAEKPTIVNVYKKCVTDQPDMKKANMVHYISEVVGVSRATVYRTVAEYKSTGTTSDAKKATGRPSLLESFEETVKTTVRQIVHNMFRRNELSTLDKILTEIRNNDDIPNMDRTTLYRFMRQINFKYIKRSRNSILTEKNDIVAEVTKLLHTAISNVTATTWDKCIGHVIKEEIRMSNLDEIIDNVIEPFIISVGEDSDTVEYDLSE